MAVTEEVYTSLIRDLLNINTAAVTALTARIATLETSQVLLQRDIETLAIKIGQRLG